MIRTVDLSKAFDRRLVFNRVSVTIEPGERVALVGLNGAGKTTLFRCILGLTGYEGSLRVDGHEVRDDGRAARTHLGYVPQRSPQFDGTLDDMLSFFCRLRGIGFSDLSQRLGAMGLHPDEHGSKPVTALSGGMLQKSLLALALEADVSVLLLDEPTANLDPAARRDFLAALRAVRKDVAVVLASHRLSDVEAVADRVLVLHEGGIAFDGPLGDLTTRLGSDTTLWMKIPDAFRTLARARLCDIVADADLRGENGAMGVAVPRSRGADLLHQLRSEGVPVDDFWFETPTLQSHLERMLASSTRNRGGEVESQ